MDYEALNDRLKSLAHAYDSTREQGKRLHSLFSGATQAIIPSLASIRQLSEAHNASVESIKAEEDALRRLRVLQSSSTYSAELKLITLAMEGEERAADGLGKSLERLRKDMDAITSSSHQSATATIELKRLKKEAEELETKQGNHFKEIYKLESESLKLERSITKEKQAILDQETKIGKLQAQAVQNSKQVVDWQTKGFKLLKDQAAIWVTTAAIVKTIGANFTFNSKLIEANSSAKVRNGLFESALKIQNATGDSLDNITGIMAEIRSQTGLYNQDLVHVATTASKLSQGLGLTLDQTGDLLETSRALRVNFDAMANSISNIVDKTSLGARDAVDLIKGVRDGLLQFNVVGDAIQPAIDKVTALEEALKSVGASRGTALRILTPYTDLGQSGGVGQSLGSGGVDFLRDPKRIQALEQGLVQVLKPFRDSPMVFKQMAEGFGIAAADAQLLIRAVEVQSQVEAKLATDRKGFAQRFAEQTADAGKVWGQLGQQLKSLLMDAFRPLTWAALKLSEALGGARDALAKMPDWAKVALQFVGTAVAATALIGVLGTAIKLIRAFAATAAVLAGTGRGGAAGQVGGAVAEGILGRIFKGGLRPAGVAGSALEGALRARMTGAAVVGAAGTGVKALTATVETATAQGISVGWKTILTKQTVSQLFKNIGSEFLVGGAIRGFLAAALPIALPIVIAAGVGYAIKMGLESVAAQNVKDMEGMRNKDSSSAVRQEVEQKIHTSLDKDSGVDAITSFVKQFEASRADIMAKVHDPKNNNIGQIVNESYDGIREQLQNRLQQATAEWSQKAIEATPEKQADMQTGLLQIVSALQELVRLQNEDVAETKRVWAQRRADEKAATEDEARREAVKYASRGKVVPNPFMIPR